MRRALMTAPALAVLLLACGPTKVRVSDTTSQFQSTADLAKDRAASDTGYFYARMVGDSVEPKKFWTGSVSVDGALLVMDAGIQIKTVDHAAYYRLTLFPRQIDQGFIDALPQGIKTQIRPSSSEPYTALYSKFPADRTPDATGAIVTDWAYCPDCTGKGRTNSDSAKRLVRLAKLGSQSTNNVTFTFTSTIPSAVKFGSEADMAALADAAAEKESVRMAEKKAADAEKKRVEEEEERLYGDARRAYKDFAKEADASPLALARRKKCGSLVFRDPPGVVGRNARDRFEEGMESNVERFEEHVECVTDFLESADYVSYAQSAADQLAKEEALWTPANLPEKERVDILSVEDMVAQEEKYVSDSANRLERIGKTYERAWDNYVEEENRRAERAAKAKRRKQVERDTKECLFGLASRGALTPYSQGFCKTQAEKGISGFQAAQIGSAGAGSSSTPAFRSAIPSFEELSKFNLAGMVANAREASRTGDASLLWDKSGRIRNTIAPQLLRPSGSSTSAARVGSSRSESNSGSRSSYSAPSSRSASAAASASGGSALEKARAASAAVEADRSASGGTVVAGTTTGTGGSSSQIVGPYDTELVDDELEAQAKREADAIAAEAERRAAEQEAERLAEIERLAEEQVERERAEAERKAAEQAERERREAERRAAEAERKRLAAIKPPRYGGNSRELAPCAKIVDTVRRTGKSAHSSCSYSEPDRQSVEIIMVNRCTYPIDVKVNVGLDVGGMRSDTLYSIKPGRKKRTVDFCGAMNWEYSYEETRDAYKARTDP